MFAGSTRTTRTTDTTGTPTTARRTTRRRRTTAAIKPAAVEQTPVEQTPDERLIALVTNRDVVAPPGVFTFRAMVNVGNPELSEALLATDWLLHLALNHPKQAQPIIAGVRESVNKALKAVRK